MDDRGRDGDSETEDINEEIVWDRVKRTMAFLYTWSVILPTGLIKTSVQEVDTHKPVPQLQ